MNWKKLKFSIPVCISGLGLDYMYKYGPLKVLIRNDLKADSVVVPRIVFRNMDMPNYHVWKHIPKTGGPGVPGSKWDCLEFAISRCLAEGWTEVEVWE